MKLGQAFVYPEEQQRLRSKAKKLSWLSIGLLFSAGTLLYFTLGQSEAMKTAWVSDILTAIPPMALLVAMRYELREPSKRFPYGYTRSNSVAFLVTSAILSLIGLYLLYESVMKLLEQQRPPIGTMELFGHQFWAGWAMIVALAYSMSCGMLIGLLKKPVAKKLNDKALNAEAAMNKAEWMSEGAAIIGVILVGFGHWWGDAAAAAFISIEIVRDGWMNTRLVIGDLMDESPTQMGTHELEDITVKVRRTVEKMDGVSDAAVRLREHGRVLTGEVFVVLGDDGDIVRRSEQVATRAREVDWRLHDIAVMPVAQLDERDPPRVASRSRDGAQRQ
jgi:cation diffusion facilitator family transporter